MQNGKLIEAMNDALNREVSTTLRYLLQGSLIQGRKNEPLREMYRREVSEEIGHARYLADKIVVLGGTPNIDPDLSEPPTEIPAMIENDIQAEEADVAHYKKLAEMAEKAGEVELKLRMEEQAADEARHAEELRRMRG